MAQDHFVCQEGLRVKIGEKARTHKLFINLFLVLTTTELVIHLFFII
jgi:hypothetical protein